MIFYMKLSFDEKNYERKIGIHKIIQFKNNLFKM